MLEGRIVRLEPLVAEHLDGLIAAGDEDPSVFRWLSADPSKRWAAWLADALAERDAGRESPFATISVATGRPVGSTRFLTLRPEHRGVEIGWTWLARSAWGTGANVEAKLLLMEHAFERLECIRVEFKTDALNERSRGALAALPAQFEGILRRHMVCEYGLRDSAYYSVLDEEWPAVKANLERRLATS